MVRAERGHQRRDASNRHLEVQKTWTKTNLLRKAGSQDGHRQRRHHQHATPPPQGAAAASWLLRELRPVSYFFKEANDAKVHHSDLRFGFVAQELETVLPSVVYEKANDGHKSVIYQDLLAVLTFVAQVHEHRYDALLRDLSELRDMLADLRLQKAESTNDVPGQRFDTQRTAYGQSCCRGVGSLENDIARIATAVLALDARVSQLESSNV